MEDITKPKAPTTPIKEHVTSLLIANVPGSIIVAALKVLIWLNRRRTANASYIWRSDIRRKIKKRKGPSCDIENSLVLDIRERRYLFYSANDPYFHS